jgi:hypothetical protein
MEFKALDLKRPFQTQDLPGSEHKMDPKPVYIRENYKGSVNCKTR